MVSLARALDFEVIAEGVETPAQCYYFGRPAGVETTIEALETFLSRR